MKGPGRRMTSRPTWRQEPETSWNHLLGFEDESPQVCPVAPQADIGLGLMGGPLHICLSWVVLSKLKKKTTLEIGQWRHSSYMWGARSPLNTSQWLQKIVLLSRSMLIAPGLCWVLLVEGFPNVVARGTVELDSSAANQTCTLKIRCNPQDRSFTYLCGFPFLRKVSFS